MIEYLSGLKTTLHHTVLGQFPLLERAVFQLIDFLTGPVTGVGTRLHWFAILEALGLAAVVYLTGRQVRPSGGWRGFIRYCFPKELYTHASAIVDYQLAILNTCFGFFFNVTWRLNTVVFTTLYLSWLVALLGPAPHASAWTTSTLIGATVLILLAEDLSNYTFHYLGHKIPMLWQLHKVHHSAEVLTPLTAFRTHPLEYAFAGAWRSMFSSLAIAPLIYFFTGPPSTLEIFGIAATLVFVGGLGTVLQHSHIWVSFGHTMDHIICGPALHQVHHSQAPHHWDRNFGVIFSFWDWMFGTLVIPDGPEKLVLGLAGETRQPHGNAIAAWCLPFWEMLPFRHKIVDMLAWVFGPAARGLAERINLVRPMAESHDSVDPAVRS